MPRNERRHIFAKQIGKRRTKGRRGRPATQARFVHEFIATASAHPEWLRELWGQWPGEETIGELLEVLRQRRDYLHEAAQGGDPHPCAAIFGQIRGDESDEAFAAAIEELS